jgi:hypothetical protein
LSVPSTLLLATAACTTPAGPPGGGGAPAPAPGGCAPVEVLAARGTGEPQTGSFIMGGLTRGIAQQTQGRVYQVRYPAVADFLNGPNQGATDALNRIRA